MLIHQYGVAHFKFRWLRVGICLSMTWLKVSFFKRERREIVSNALDFNLNSRYYFRVLSIKNRQIEYRWEPVVSTTFGIEGKLWKIGYRTSSEKLRKPKFVCN